MATSQIEITFNADLTINEYVNFRMRFNNGTVDSGWQVKSEQWKTNRNQAGQVAIGTPTSNVGERSAINFAQAFEIDYPILQNDNPNEGVFWSALEPNKVIIRAMTFYSFDLNDLPNTNSPNVSFNIENFDFGGDILQITSIDIEEATTNPACTHYKALVNTSVIAENMTAPEVINGNTDNPIEVEIPRGQGFIASVNDGASQSASLGILALGAPPLMNANNIQTQISPSPQGATVIINYLTNAVGQTFEYSINGVDWFSSNTFTNVLDGDYQFYVRNLGCEVNTEVITIENTVGARIPNHFVSRSNSIRYALQETFSNCGPYKREDNTLSHQSYAIDPDLAYCERQLFQTCDTNVMTQLKTNYSNVEANVITSDGSKDPLIVTQMTTFMNRKDSRDAIRYNVGSNKTGIYFTSGNTYDYDTDAQVSTYALNGAFPEWVKIGAWFSFSGGWYQIEALIFDESLNADVIVIDSIYTGSPETIIVKSIFNREEYEAFEFSVNMSSYTDQIIEVEILLTDDDFDDVRYLSEKIYVKDRFEETVQIDYWFPFNTEIIYSTGIKHRIRIPLLKIEPGHEDPSSINRGDNSSNLISSEVYDVDEFLFGLVTLGIYKKTLLAISHKECYIDGVSYVKVVSAEKEGPIDSSNLYTLKAGMLRANRQEVNSVQNINTDIILDDGEALEIPNIQSDEDGNFMSYDE